nr:hypothetical protein [Tanacetum cinerariifolium]
MSQAPKGLIHVVVPGVNTPQSDEDRLKLKELMELSRVDSSEDEQSLGEDASKQGRKINDIDADKGITLVDETIENQGRFNDQDDTAMFDADKDLQALEALKTSKPKIKGIVIREQEELSESRTTTTIIYSNKSQDKGKGLQAKEQQELNDEEKATLFMQLLEKRRKFFAAKRVEEKRNKPPIRAQQRSIMCTYLKNMKGWKSNTLKNKSFANIQELFDKEMKRVNTFVDYRTEFIKESFKKAEAEVIEGSSKRAGTELEKESSKKQKIDDGKETAELKQLVKIIPDEEGVEIDAIPLAVQPSSIVDWKIHKKGKKSYYQIIRRMEVQRNMYSRSGVGRRGAS